VELVRTLVHLWDMYTPALSRERARWKSVLWISSLPSSLSADEPSVFVRMIHR